MAQMCIRDRPEGMGEPVPLGDYLVTAYCVEEYPHICGGNGVTATGTKPTPVSYTHLAGRLPRVYGAQRREHLAAHQRRPGGRH